MDREADIEKYLTGRVRRMHGEAYKFTSPARCNVPDRLILLPGGRSLFAELKAPGKKPTAGQAREHERLRALGQRVDVIDSRDRVDALIHELLTQPVNKEYLRGVRGVRDAAAAAKGEPANIVSIMQNRIRILFDIIDARRDVTEAELSVMREWCYN